MKKIILLTMLLLLFLSGCNPTFDPILRYSGEHKELVAAAIYSMPGVQSETGDDILILEEDDYERTLYAICLDRDMIVSDKARAYDWQVLALVITQGSDETHVYFYGEQNYRMRKIPGTALLTQELVDQYFDETVISQLKYENNWGIPQDETDREMVKAPIQVEKGVYMSGQQRKMLEEYTGSNLKTEFLRQDQEGRQLYFVLEIQNNPEAYVWYAVIFDDNGELPNGEADIVRIPSLYSIHTTIADFLDSHDWVEITN